MGLFENIGSGIGGAFDSVGRGINDAAKGLNDAIKNTIDKVTGDLTAASNDFFSSCGGAYKSSMHDLFGGWQTHKTHVKDETSKLLNDPEIGVGATPAKVVAEHTSLVNSGNKLDFNNPNHLANMGAALATAEKNPKDPTFNQSITPLDQICQQTVNDIHNGNTQLSNDEWDVFLPIMARGAFVEKQTYSDSNYDNTRGQPSASIRDSLRFTIDQSNNGNPSFSGVNDAVNQFSDTFNQLFG